MDDYLTIFREAVYDAQAVYVNPRDFDEYLTEGLGSDLTRTDSTHPSVGGCVGTFGSVRIFTDPNVPLGTIHRSVGF
jgi:hypothetical protein